MEEKMKKVIAIVICVAMLFTFAACTAETAPSASASTETSESVESADTNAEETNSTGENFKVGFAFYNLSNPIWAEVVESAVELGPEYGMDVTYVDAGEDSSTQISQIENFIQSGMDAICILAIDVEAVEPIAKKAMDEGIIVVDYARGMENVDYSLSMDPVSTATALVEIAADWINEHYSEDETVEWGFLDIPTVEIGVREGETVREKMPELVPNSVEVGHGATLTVDEGMKNTETILQANPDCRVILSLGAGGGVGGNEAIKASVDPSQYGEYALFSIDATEQEVLNIINGDPQKGSISPDSGRAQSKILLENMQTLLNGGTVEKYDHFPVIKVTTENAQEYYDERY